MTKQEFINNVKAIAEANKFYAIESNVLGGVEIRDFNDFGDEHFVNISIVPGDHEYNMNERSVTWHFTIKASCSSMGGDPSADGLRRQADALTRAANLMEMADAFSRMGYLNYTENF